ncbi:MAG: hypothetical protein ACI9OJ_000079 [Myxococcota bacterium]|jgi:hypothetical protein
METGIRGDRRILGALAARLDDLRLDKVEDPRGSQGKLWALPQLLTACLAGIVSGCHSLRETEELTDNLPAPLRVRFGLPKRVPDTTLRTTVSAVEPDELREVIHRQIKQANRRKQIRHDGYPFGVIAIDGKCTSTPFIDDHYAQRQTLKARDEIVGVQGLVRTLTCCLITSPAKPVLDAGPIPAATNEVGHFATYWNELISAYGRTDIFSMVTLDAGFTSAENAALIHETGYAYLMRLKDARRELTSSAIRRLGHLSPRQAKEETHDKVGSSVVTRRLWIEPIEDVEGWPHARGILRVQSSTDANGGEILHDRYYVTNYAAAGLNAGHWLALVRGHWAVENNNHWVFDTAFAEDANPQILTPQGMLNMILFRRIGYTILAFFRAVTLRSEPSRATPWPALLRAVNRALMRATERIVSGLRRRRPASRPA